MSSSPFQCFSSADRSFPILWSSRLRSPTIALLVVWPSMYRPLSQYQGICPKHVGHWYRPQSIHRVCRLRLLNGSNHRHQNNPVDLASIWKVKSESKIVKWPTIHDDVIKWKHFPRYWPFVWGIHRSPVNSPHKGQWRRALMFSLIRVWINGWINNREAGDLRRHRAHYDVMKTVKQMTIQFITVMPQVGPMASQITSQSSVCLTGWHKNKISPLLAL